MSVPLLLCAFAICLVAAVILLLGHHYSLGTFFGIVSFFPAKAIVVTFIKFRTNAAYLLSAVEAADFSFRYSVETEEKKDNTGVNDYLNSIIRVLEGMHDNMLEKERYFEIILNSTDAGILVVDDQGVVHQCNQAACRLFNLPVISRMTQLARVNPSLPDMLRSRDLPPTVELTAPHGKLELAVQRVSIPIRGKMLDIYSLNDIHRSLENKELESWNQLTRTLTHEIMNTLTPVTSICDSLASQPDLPLDEVRKNLDTISNASKGLLRFVENYRSFVKVPQPAPSLFYVKPFLERMCNLAKHQYPESNVNIRLLCNPADMLLFADEQLATQVVTNIIKNAVRACKECDNPKILIEARINPNESITIEISNNGPLIPSENIDQIFVPFFTTNPDGNGIGLSLARRMMHASGGELRLVARPLTKFVLIFN